MFYVHNRIRHTHSRIYVIYVYNNLKPLSGTLLLYLYYKPRPALHYTRFIKMHQFSFGCNIDALYVVGICQVDIPTMHVLSKKLKLEEGGKTV